MLITPLFLSLAASCQQSPTDLKIDPLLLAQGAEVWSIIGSDSNPIWPGWDATKTPLLFYLLGVQELLVNHPNPPEDYEPYLGPLRFPVGEMYVRNEKTVMEWDGQNTSTDLNGVETLVVADTISNMRQQLGSFLHDTRSAEEKRKDLNVDLLSADPYDQLTLIVHEAFHVYQFHMAPDKAASEMLLLDYPVLSARNTLGFALEGRFLKEALQAETDSEFRAAATKWLAVRLDRRSVLGEEAIEYENGTEWSEGLAMYTEYKLFQLLQNREPAPELYWARGFNGYEGIKERIRSKEDRMEQFLSGEVSVNNDPYGTAPIRMQFYHSGMAIGVLLDRLGADWKHTILEPGTTLTGLAQKAIGASKSQLSRALVEAKQHPEYADLKVQKADHEQKGRRMAVQAFDNIMQGEGSLICLDYSALQAPNVGWGFTPFGITKVDEQKTIFKMVPISARIGTHGTFSQNMASPVLHDAGKKQIFFRLPWLASAEELSGLVGAERGEGKLMDKLKIDVKGVSFDLGRGRVQRTKDGVCLKLLP